MVRLALTLILAPLSMFVSGAHAQLDISAVAPLGIRPARTPPVPQPQVITGGTYPQVMAAAPRSFSRVNRALRDAVESDEEKFAQLVSAQRADPRVRGEYRTRLDRRFVSASTVVVSALMPAIEILPGLNGGSTWVSMTVWTATGQPVELRDLFSQPGEGLKALSKLARREVIRKNHCARESLSDPVSASRIQAGYNPTYENYKFFALLPQGVTIGFRSEQVGAPVCGRVSVTVSYGRLRGFLSITGRRLVGGVRPPAR